MSFNRTESSKWAIASAELVGKYEEGRDKALSDAASRGFAAADGSSLAAILAMGQEIKGKLTEFNGTKIYDDRRKVLFEQDEFAMKMIVSLAKLGMELYRAELFNLLEIEAAENTALRDRGNADVIRQNAEVDKRQVAIIRDRAEIERRITILKEALVDAETVTLVSERALITAQLGTTEKKLEVVNSIYEVIIAERTTLGSERTLITAQLATAEKRLEVIDSTYRVIDAENTTLISERALIVAQIETAREKLEVINAIYALLAAERITMTSEQALINAQLETAEKKLEIIESIYQVLAAEELVLIAENKRVATLTLLLAAQRIVADIKKAMIPFYLEKASAKQDLAVAITNEIPITKSIVELGYDRITLKNTEEAAAHQIREAQEEAELASVSWHRAREATEIARAQSRRLLQVYANAVQSEIMGKKKSLNEDGIDLELDTSLARQGIGVNNEVAVSEHDVSNLTAELINLLLNITARASDEVSKVKASATQTSFSDTNHMVSRKIIEGFYTGTTFGGEMSSG